MNSKRTGVAFLLLVLINYIVVIGLTAYMIMNPEGKELSIVANLILSQLMVLCPVALVIFIGRKKREPERLIRDVLGFRRIKLTTALMMVLYTYLVMPLATLANVISMFFVDNAVAEIEGDILNVSFFIIFPLMAVFGPLSEEIVCRGAFYRGFRKSGNVLGAVLLSALLFALMHMNFNQAAYAFLVGVMMALAAEATGSTAASFIMHFIYNGQSVCLMYLQKIALPEELMEELTDASLTTEELIMMTSVYLFLAVVCTAIAFCVLTWMAENEGKQNFLRTVWALRKVRKERLWSVCLIIGVILSLIYMIFIALL